MKRVWLLVAALTLLFGDEMKVCESEQDKMSGCVEMGYYANGLPRFEMVFRDGKAEGWGTLYNKYGGIGAKALFKNNKVEETILYYGDGSIKSRFYYRDSVLEGVAKHYFPSGELRAETLYKNGKISGEEKWYSQKGDLIFSVIYRDDEPVSGKCANGKVLTSAHLHNIKRRVGSIDCWSF